MVVNLNLKIESQNLEAELVSTLYEFYLRHHLGKTNELIEILWIEVQGRNKNTPVLIGVVINQVLMELKNLFRSKRLSEF